MRTWLNSSKTSDVCQELSASKHVPLKKKGPGAEIAEADQPRRISMNNNSSLSRVPAKAYSQASQLFWADASLHENQTQISYRFAADHNGKLLHIHNAGWMVWDSTRWIPDTGPVQAALLDTLWRLRKEAAAMLAEAAASHDKAMERKAKDLLSLVKSCESASGLAGVLKIASGLIGMTTTMAELDTGAYLLNMPNGTLNLETMELQQHDPADRITKITRGSFNPANPAKSDLWNSFVERILPAVDVRDFFQRTLGLAMIGAVIEHILVIATGVGRNGKGVAYGAVMNAMGDYAAVADDGLFEVQRSNNPQAASPGLAKLRGVRFLAVSELEERARLAAAFMKRMTGGDRITARELYGSPFEFAPAFLIMMITNYLPKLPANDAATWARVRVIPFDVVIPPAQRDVHLGTKLNAEADAVLTWALEGLEDYQAAGLREPVEVMKATQNYADSQDDVRRFVDSRCTGAPANGGDTTSELSQAYQTWAAEEGIHQAHVLGRSKFGEALDKLGFPSTKQARGAVRVGLGIDPNAV